MPPFQGLAQQAGVPNVARSMPAVRSAQSGESPYFAYPYSISGVSRDSAGTPLGGCQMALFRTSDNSSVSQVVSDASGNYVIAASNLLQHYVVAYKAGNPDVAGVSVNTLAGA